MPSLPIGMCFLWPYLVINVELLWTSIFPKQTHFMHLAIFVCFAHHILSPKLPFYLLSYAKNWSLSRMQCTLPSLLDRPLLIGLGWAGDKCWSDSKRKLSLQFFGKDVSWSSQDIKTPCVALAGPSNFQLSQSASPQWPMGMFSTLIQVDMVSWHASCCCPPTASWPYVAFDFKFDLAISPPTRCVQHNAHSNYGTRLAKIDETIANQKQTKAVNNGS